jgi:hypothetical protein
MAAYSNLYISKRAVDLELAKKEILGIWRPNEGFFQNLFRLASYAIPFVPGLGWVVFVVEKIAGMFNKGLSDLGEYFDKGLGTGPGSKLDLSDILERLARWFKGLFSKMLSPAIAKSDDEQLQKIAILGGLLQLIGGGIRLVPKIISVLGSFIGWLMMAVGANNIDKMLKILEGKVTDKMQDVMKEKIQEQMNPMSLLGLLPQGA